MAKSAKREEGSAQFERFIETARSLGCDEDKEKFEATLGGIAKYRPPPKTTKSPKNKKHKPAQ